MFRNLTRLALVGLLSSCGEVPPETSRAGSPVTTGTTDSVGMRVWKTQCAACHGVNGEGIQALGAPALTQLPTNYLTRQLSYFMGGVRGAHPDDTAGRSMAISVSNLSENDISDLTTLMSKELPPAFPKRTIRGNIKRGEDYYINLCSSCHGGDALGNKALHAPPLAGVNDWYLRNQYQAFLKGLRGRHPDDPYGAQMARLAPALSNSDDIDDVISYLASLPPRRL